MSKVSAVTNVPVKPTLKKVIIELSPREASVLHSLVGACSSDNELMSLVNGLSSVRGDYLEQMSCPGRWVQNSHAMSFENR